MVKADETREMLKAIMNNLSLFKQEMLSKFKDIDTKLTSKFDSVDQKIDNVEKNLTHRLDAIGKQLAYLEDDAPTRDEFNHLEKRVGTLERKTSAAA